MRAAYFAFQRHSGPTFSYEIPVFLDTYFLPTEALNLHGKRFILFSSHRCYLYRY